MTLKTGTTLKDLLPQFSNAPKGNVKIDCLWCGSNKMYVQTNEHAIHPTKKRSTYGNFHCKKCERKGGMFTILSKLGKLEFLVGKRIDIGTNLKNLFIDDTILEVVEPMKSIDMPIGFVRQYSNDYLDSRKLTHRHYREYSCGMTNVSMNFRDHVLIGMYQDREIKAFMGRYIGNREGVHKYNNSRSNFGRILGGSDELHSLTTTVIAVEGFFDKVAIDVALKLHNRFDMKCVHLNGKSFSDTQMMKLLEPQGVQHLIFALDLDAKKQIKALGGNALNIFDKVSGVTTQSSRDWSDLSNEEIVHCFDFVQPIEQFARTQIAIDFSKIRI